ncbi:DNA mismatch repair protein MutL [Lentinula edodes]|nr:DNA mismatch repair protein MutL [Lentinula edodes]KAJ3915541.1 DNA mismatch repair protein MutL [Lentinula edodes]
MSESLTPPTPESSFNGHGVIKAIEGSSVHRLTSGQVVIDLQTAVKELVENSLDAGATSIDVRFKNCGLKSIEVVDNGSGISEKDFDSIGRKHHTSKLAVFHDLMAVTSFGFRGEALSSLCALCEGVTVTTATTDKAPMGSVLELDKRGEIKSRAKGVKQRGTTVLLTSLFSPLPVRRKELERNIKREFGKALALLNAYALGPCCGLGADKAVRFSVTNQPDKGAKTTHISLPLPSPAGVTLSLRTVRAGTIALWGPKALGGVIDLDLEFEVPRKLKGKSRVEEDVDLREDTFKIHVKGLISSPTPIPSSGLTPRSGGSARSTTDRQFFYVNGRPCTLSKIQKAINDIYRTFIPSNATSGQFPFVVADFTIPGDAVDVNVTPDKRTILVHAEAELCDRMKVSMLLLQNFKF